jgi:uncharacterized protein YjbK
MPTPPREIEFKFAVDDDQAFHRLVRHLQLPDTVLDQGVTQTNHFFDSPQLCLRNKHSVIRLREQGEKRILTVKGEKTTRSSNHAVLTDRIEQEAEVSIDAATALLQQRTTPQAVIAQYFADRASDILQAIDSACHGQTLVHIGQFENVRIHLPETGLDIGGASEMVEFELDTSTYPDGRIDRELEIEISEHANADAIETALTGLLAQAGIEWHSAPSKAVRFFGALKRDGNSQEAP